MFSLADLTRGLQAGQLDPEWLVAENAAGASYNEFVKRYDRKWVTLSELSMICSPEELAPAAISSDPIVSKPRQAKPDTEVTEPVSSAELRAFMRAIKQTRPSRCGCSPPFAGQL